MFFNQEWSSFYHDSPEVNISDGSNPVSKSTQLNYFVKFCIFYQIRSTSISFSSTTENIKVLVEDTLFSTCSSEGNGGSIFFGDKGQFSQNRDCGYRSKTTSNGVFCDITVSTIYKNKIFDSSISYSGDEYNQGTYNIYFTGSCNVSNINTTKAMTYGRSLYHFVDVNDESVISLSTFANNSHKRTDESYYSSAIYGTTSSVIFNIFCCNYLYNIGSKHSESSLIYSKSLKTTISNCSFIGNKGMTFRFFRDAGELVAEYCYFADNQKDSGKPKIKNTILELSMALLSHIKIKECASRNSHLPHCTVKCNIYNLFNGISIAALLFIDD